MLLGAEGAGIEGRSGYGEVGIIQRGGSRAVQRGERLAASQDSEVQGKKVILTWPSPHELRSGVGPPFSLPLFGPEEILGR